MMSKEPLVIENGTFYSRWNKSNASAAFIQKDETYLVWPGPKNQEEQENSLHCLHIYNLSQMKKELVIETGDSAITLVTTYPKNARFDSKKYLICANDFGVLFIYDIQNQGNKFEELLKFNTNSKIGILSAVIFDDPYDDLEKKEKNEYVIVSFEDYLMQIHIYQINWENKEKVGLIKVIQNPLEKHCCLMDYYNDKNLKRSFLVFGFQTSIRLYNLKEDHWGKDFKLKGHPTSLIIFDKKEIWKGDEIIKKYLIFSQANDSITLVDLDAGIIIYNFSNATIKYVNDLCFWNEEENLMVVSVQNENSIKLLRLSDWQIMFSKEVTPYNAINCLKVLVKNKTSRLFEEKIVVCQKGKNHRILIFEL